MGFTTPVGIGANVIAWGSVTIAPRAKPPSRPRDAHARNRRDRALRPAVPLQPPCSPPDDAAAPRFRDHCKHQVAMRVEVVDGHEQLPKTRLAQIVDQEIDIATGELDRRRLAQRRRTAQQIPQRAASNARRLRVTRAASPRLATTADRGDVRRLDGARRAGDYNQRRDTEHQHDETRQPRRKAVRRKCLLAACTYAPVRPPGAADASIRATKSIGRPALPAQPGDERHHDDRNRSATPRTPGEDDGRHPYKVRTQAPARSPSRSTGSARRRWPQTMLRRRRCHGRRRRRASRRLRAVRGGRRRDTRRRCRCRSERVRCEVEGRRVGVSRVAHSPASS